MKKRLLALLTALVMAVSLTGCMGNLYNSVLTIEGEDIDPGLYLMMQIKAYSDAENLAEDPEKDVLKQKIEGQSATSWIREKTEEYCRRYIAVQLLCKKYDVKLSDESWQSISDNLGYWEYMSTYYTENGIGYESFRYQLENSFMDNELFYVLYGEGGELAHSKADSQAAYEAQNAHVRYLSLPSTVLTTDDGETVDEGAEAQVWSMMEAMKKRLEAGDSFEEIATEDIAPLYELLGRGFDVEAAEDYIYTSYIDYESEYYDEEYLADLKGASVGDFGLYDNDGYIILWEKIPAFADDEEWEEQQDTVLNALYSDEYDEWMADVYNGYTVKKAFLAQWYYRPSKIE